MNKQIFNKQKQEQKKGENNVKRRYTDVNTHPYQSNNNVKFQNDSELIFSQMQTPQYKQSEIGNPISSPNTDDRFSGTLQ